jgi:hypothetical protein
MPDQQCEFNVTSFVRVIQRNVQFNQPGEGRGAIAKGIIRNWISDDEDRQEFSAQLARGLLGQDGKPCSAIKELDEGDKERLRAVVLLDRSDALVPGPFP